MKNEMETVVIKGFIGIITLITYSHTADEGIRHIEGKVQYIGQPRWESFPPSTPAVKLQLGDCMGFPGIVFPGSLTKFSSLFEPLSRCNA